MARYPWALDWTPMAPDVAPDPLTTTEHALLGMLARYGEHSGYELLKLAESGIGFIWSPAKSHVYDVLPRLSGARARAPLGAGDTS